MDRHSTLRHGETADPERRFRSYALDRLIGWATAAAVGLAVGRAHGLAAGFGAGTLVLTATTVGLAVLLGTCALTPGLAAHGLRVVRRSDGRPIGVGAALLRGAVLGSAGVPTGGLGVAALAWTALMDRAGERRGLHDRIAGSIVVSARAAPAPTSAAPPGPPGLVNLTAMRLLPDPEPGIVAAAPPARAPVAARRAPGEWRLVADSGEEVAVDGGSRVGSVHLRVTRDGALVAMDRGGSPVCVVRRGHRRRLTAGRPATLLDGDLLVIGERRCRVECRGGAG